MKVKIDVSCKYWVGKEIDLPDDIAKQMMNKVGRTISSDSELSEYLCDRIHEDDAYEWEFEIGECEEVRDG